MSDVESIVPCDFHIHTSFSHDGEGTVMEYCKLAAQRGMTAIGFCEHVDLDERDIVSGHHDYEAYRAEVEEARSRFGDRVNISMGAEVGFVPSISNVISDFLGGREYDYVVGSVHAINDGMSGISEQYDALETFARHEPADAYAEYFETVNDMVVSGLFDVVGHLDLVRRFGVDYEQGVVEWGSLYPILQRVMDGVIKRQMAIEINTSGLRQIPKETYPSRRLLQLYKEVGGERVILGSDAHAPKDLGAGIPAAIKLVRELKLKPVRFSNRLPEAFA